MLSEATKYKLYVYLKAVAENEVMIEEQRQELGKQEEFEPYAAFKRLLSNAEDPKANVLSPKDICKFLR